MANSYPALPGSFKDSFRIRSSTSWDDAVDSFHGFPLGWKVLSYFFLLVFPIHARDPEDVPDSSWHFNILARILCNPHGTAT